jgi:aspartate-semialdehyde dehydrogenase
VNGVRVAVVGATGAVGREIVRLLEERAFPLDDLVLVASARSEGRQLAFRGEELSVRALADGWHEGIDVALVSAGAAVSREILPQAAAAGMLGVDNSPEFRMDPAVPLVIPEINAHDLAWHRGIVANPNCTAITALVPLGPLHRSFGLRFLVTSSYQSASGSGMKGVRELAEQVEKLRGDEESLLHPDPGALPGGEVFPRTLAYNVVPVCASPDPNGSGFTTEELKMGDEARKILGIPNLECAATAVRVPVVAGHGVSAYARFDAPISADAAREALREAPGMRLVDDLESGAFPTPLDAAGIDEVLVGRIRQPAGDGHALLFFSVADNLRKGAALNAVQIAEHLVA